MLLELGEALSLGGSEGEVAELRAAADESYLALLIDVMKSKNHASFNCLKLIARKRARRSGSSYRNEASETKIIPHRRPVSKY